MAFLLNEESQERRLWLSFDKEEKKRSYPDFIIRFIVLGA